MDFFYPFFSSQGEGRDTFLREKRSYVACDKNEQLQKGERKRLLEKRWKRGNKAKRIRKYVLPFIVHSSIMVVVYEYTVVCTIVVQ